MKRNVFILAFVAMSFMAMAQQWTGIGSNAPAGPQVKLISSSEQQVVVDFTLNGFNLTRVSTPNGIQHIVSVPKMASMLEAGAPDLPQFPVPAIIGDRAEMEVSVTHSAYTDYENIEIAPSKGNFSRQIDPATVPYTYGEMYNVNAFYPVLQAHLESPYIVRDFRGQNIMVTPFAYNPVTKTLRVYHHMTIEMNKVSNNGLNQKVARRANRKMSSEMQATYDHRFVNYRESASRYTFVHDRGEMLVICPAQYREAMQPFVDWKNQSGRPTTMVSLSEAGGNSDTQIKAYIQNIYNNPDRNLEYILLVGDYNELTPHSMSGGYSDNWFGQLEGDDYYIEVFTGRFSVESVQDVTTQVDKVIYYERDIDENATWLNHGIGIGANEGAGSGHNGGEADYVHIDYIRDTLMHYTYETVSQQYSGVGSGTSANAISADFNEGVSICNYCNHGSQTSWAVASYSNTQVNALVNDDKWPFIWSVACYNGQFNTTCFAEAWLRATNGSTGRPTGAIGGMFSWISQPWTPPMTGQDEMIDILTEWKYSDQFDHTFGGASLNGNMYILDMHPSDNGATHNTWLLFGDPSLMVRTDNPTRMNVSCNPSTLMLGMSSMEVTAENTAFGIATLMMDGEVLSTGYIQNGTVNLEFSPMSMVGNATLTVMGYNKVTEVVNVEVLPAEGAYLTINGYTPNAAPVNQETNLSMSFKNVGADPTSGITTVSLTCNDNRLNITDSIAELEVLPADETITLQDAFSFIIAEGVEDATRFQIDVEMTCGTETWIGKVYVTANEAVLEYKNMSWDGGFTPGETLTLSASFKNTGHYQATNAMIALTTSSDYVTINTPSVEVGTLEVGQEVTYEFSVTIATDCPETAVLPITFTMTADGGLTAIGNENLKNACNVIFDLMDSYGDGWNGAALVVSFDDGTASQSLTFSSGSSASYPIEIGNGVHVTLTWTSGSYDGECTFTVSYEGDLVIYQQTSRPSAGVLYEFDCNCAAGSQSFTVNVSSSNTEYGTVSGGGEYSFGQSCTVTATPADGYMFTNWTQDGAVVSTTASYTFVVNSDVNLVANFAEGILIGDGGTSTNSYLPSYSLYNYTLSQQIYTVEELGAPGLITSIAFYNGGSTKTRSYDFYLKATTKSAFSDGTDWEVVTEADKVFSGNVVMTAGEWTFIVFDTPFLYDGNSNLVFVADDNTGSYSSGMNCRVFGASSQAIYIYSDGTNYNPFAPTDYSGTVMNMKNQIILTKDPLGDCVRPSQLTATEVGPDFASLSWTENGESTEWVIEYSIEGVPVGQFSTTMNPFTLTGLDNETTYTVKVRPLCDENLWSREISFTTLSVCPVPMDVEVGDITGNAAAVTWTGYSEGYNVQLGVPAFMTVESFDEGIPADWVNDTEYPWTVVDGHIQSGNGGNANTTSSISVAVTYPAEGTISFDFLSKGEGSDANNWDKSRFYIDDELMFDYGQHADWESYSATVSEGAHTFTWTYKKDGSVNPEGDYFAVDNIKVVSSEIIWGDPVSVEGSEHTFTGLTPVTPYLVAVQGVCGDTATEWSAPVMFVTDEGTDLSQTTELPQGWTWWSSYIELSNVDGLTMLEASMEENGAFVKSRDAFVQYSAETGEWTGTLQSIDNESGYKIMVATECTSVISGAMAQPSDHPITVSPNWSWIGYPVSTVQSVSSAMSGFEPEEGDMVKGQNGYTVYDAELGWTPSDFVLNPSEGYMYYSNATEDKTLTFAQGRNEALVSSTEENYWKTNRHAYPDNLSILATVYVNDEEQRDGNLELGAFVNGECRGSAKLYHVASIDRYVAFLTVTGQNAEQVEFKLMDESRGMTGTSDDHVTFSSNAIVGNLGNPFEVHFGALNSLAEMQRTVNIYPNPVDRNVAFTLLIPEDETVVETMVVNAMGEVVSHKTGYLTHSMMHGLPVAGVYMVKVTCKSGNVYIGRVVVK